MDLLFNGRVSEARTLIDKQLDKNPEHPKYYLVKAQFNFYMRYFDNRLHNRDSVIAIITDNARQAIKWGEAYKPTNELKFYIGSAYGFLGRAYVMNQQYWDAYWASQECMDYLGEVLQEDPQYYDAFLALGIIEYFPTRVSGFLSFVASVTGMSGDVATAFDYISKTAEKGDLLKNEGLFVLASVYRMENDNQNALKYYSQLREQFPENNLIEVQYEQLRLANVVEEQGIDNFTANIDNYIEQFSINSSAPLNNLGYSFMGQGRNDLAEGLFLLNIQLYPAEANPYDSISEFYENTGRNAEAVRFAMKGLEILPADSTADEDAKELLRGLMEERIENLSSAS